ncbi:2OG-Fe(II) oxygenase [Rippkaea orientalis PCC 8801]|uniref:PKHD-type hydroxylase PCC8801_2196 n=1 Tax=Rippkaea orientalis (strain PCC 8801 / RF-1) TaxID=41431 RepID=Y2196_RIPO1|nr:Fe2+-dependent dioxygenase [Rippkaea orientalis]B7K077.1 RecName: Full=PKHD-type hydroxylase PCC8801_2196 [Rippkaea orientalis PCC 8801]ACK66224.1 2OG-Fe(II) oxygenase [Rippkaea orientalis PCC 8801]
MILTINEVLTSSELNKLLDGLSRAPFVDGKTTAGWHAKLVKNTVQLDKNSQEWKKAENIVKTALDRNMLLKMAVLPKRIHSLLFSRYETGMSYGSHVDNGFMGGQEFWRSDVSFTLFLTSPDSYKGGELVIEMTEGERIYKLEAGSMIVYPSSFLHRVETVTDGVRLVVVGWIESLVRDPSEREFLFDLDTVRRSIFTKEGKSLEFDILSKTYANLLRKWGK